MLAITWFLYLSTTKALKEMSTTELSGANSTCFPLWWPFAGVAKPTLEDTELPAPQAWLFCAPLL